MIWGKGDVFLLPGTAEASIALCDDGRLEWIAEATHWVQHEEPDRVNRLLLEFLGPVPGHQTMPESSVHQAANRISSNEKSSFSGSLPPPPG